MKQFSLETGRQVQTALTASVNQGFSTMALLTFWIGELFVGI
jgi:hypothetical protein